MNRRPCETRPETKSGARSFDRAPLSTILRRTGLDLPDAIADIVAQIGVGYLHQEANVDTLDVRNWSVDLIFTKRFRF